MATLTRLSVARGEGPRAADLSGKPPSTELLSTNYALSYFGIARARELMEDAGLCNVGGSLPVTISKVAFWQICTTDISQTNDEGQGHTNRQIPKLTWAAVFSAVNQMDTVGDGLKKLAELVAIVPAGIGVTLGYGTESVRVTFASDGNAPLSEQVERYIEVIALAFHCVLLWVTAETINPTHLRLSEVLPERDGSLLSSLRCERTRKRSGVTVSYARQDMAIPLGVRKYKAWCVHETATFLELIANMDCGDSAKESRIANAVGRLLANEPTSQEEAALRLGVSVATLRRKLDQTGTSFRNMSREARCKKLSSLLQTDCSLDDVAVELGLSDRRSLWRICNDWLGMSPSAYRESHRSSPSQSRPSNARLRTNQLRP